MKILGIETSCDETSAAVVDHELRLLSNIVLSQDEIHAPYGGIVPELASRRHIRSIAYVVGECLECSGLRIDEIEAFAVTQGPGLIGSLLVGLSFAKGLAYTHGRPLVPADHLESHIYSAFIENRDITYPILALLVSGGHTSLFELKGPLNFRLLAKTRDDAAGEALDKIAKFLGLGYPGGPVIDRLASEGDTGRFPFARPQMSDGSLDFSFSGFKTAGLRQIRKLGITRAHPDFLDFIASFEAGVIRALLHNLDQAIPRVEPRSLILCGGVARNSKLREQFLELAENRGVPGYVPSPELCTDNAAMVAALAFEKLKNDPSPGLDLTLNAYSRR
jgi:N6-L-threonylcarbamoyladenine synthase